MLEQFIQQATGLVIGRLGRAHHDGGGAEVGVFHVQGIEGGFGVFFVRGVKARQPGRGFLVIREDLAQMVEALLGGLQLQPNLGVQRLDDRWLQAGPGISHTLHQHAVGGHRAFLRLGDQGDMHQTLLRQNIQRAGRFFRCPQTVQGNDQQAQQHQHGRQCHFSHQGEAVEDRLHGTTFITRGTVC